ncbi:hypothetical protein GS682_31795 [Nostoc sp. B(2019)]|nr:hypothetical protein [Nostoc sp. B(2019)]
MKGKKAIASFPGWVIAFTMCANSVVVYHNVLKKFKRSFSFVAQSHWHLSITKQESNNLRRSIRLQQLQKSVVIPLVISY